MKTDNKNSLSIVVPCVQVGNETGSPYSVELTKIAENSSTIDVVFDQIVASSHKPKVILVVGPEKADVAQYVTKKYGKKFDLVIEQSRGEIKDIGEVLKTVGNYLAEKTIVLLPTTIIESADGTSFVDSMVETLDSKSIVIAYKEEKSVTRLKSPRALGKNIWVSFGFIKNEFQKVSSNLSGAISDAGLVGVENFFDITTWTQANAYLLRQYLETSGIDPALVDHDNA